MSGRSSRPSQRPTGSTDDARHIGTVVIAAEETCLSVFEAADAGGRGGRDRGGRDCPADRIVEAEWFPGPST